jgi:hypothetical protein
VKNLLSGGLSVIVFSRSDPSLSAAKLFVPVSIQEVGVSLQKFWNRKIMSTPVSASPSDSFHRTNSEQDRDLQTRVQTMIDIQNDQHQQQQATPPEIPPERSLGLQKRTTTEAMDLQSMGASLEAPTSRVATATISAPFPSISHASTDPYQQGVGTGTLYFSNDYQSSFGSNRMDSPVVGENLQLHTTQQFYSDYGAVPQQQQEHEFHYGNPDYHGDDVPKAGASQQSFCAKCSFLYQPLVYLLSQEHLHRSFCFGAIDGMLTGSGIVGAFCGLGVLNTDAAWGTRLAVVAFSAAACVADSLCMAIGHIWTTYYVSSGHAQERARERHLLSKNKADAKGKLVDMLLARGMLKIDAMSLADTLEGYPDLFVSALVGDPLFGGAEDDDREEVVSPLSGRRESIGSSGGIFASWKFPSFGQFNDMDHDPEANNVNMAMKESQREGLFMLLGFSVFATIPSLLWLLLPVLIGSDPTQKDYQHNSAESGDTVSPTSLVVTISAIIMWSLGVWKSQFLDSNWILFAIETVVVLLICVISAFAVGTALLYILADNIDPATLLTVSNR